MLTFTRAYPEHVKLITPLAVQTLDYRALLTATGREMIDRSHAYTGWAAGSRCIGLAGISDFPWPGRAEAWILLGEGAAQHLVQIIRFARGIIEAYQRDKPCARVEMNIKASHTIGARIAELCGLYLEARLWKAYPDGDDILLYVRRG